MEILTWPKALKSIRFQTQAWEPGGGKRGFGMDPMGELVWDSAEEFIGALAPHRHTLEEIIYTVIRPEESDVHRNKSTVGSLQEFTSLKRLTIDRMYLIKTDEELNDYYSSGQVQRPHVTLSELPLSLEHLILSVECEFGWDPEADSYFDYALELKQWLCDVASQKSALYPSLKSILIWEDTWDLDPPNPEPYHILGLADIRAQFEQAGIKLTHEVTGGHLPNFTPCCGKDDDFECVEQYPRKNEYEKERLEEVSVRTEFVR